MGRQLVGHALASHATGKNFGNFVFVHHGLLAGRRILRRIILGHRHMEPAHLLQPADVAYRNTLPGLEFRPLELAGVNARHVVGHVFAHSLLHRHNTHAGRSLVTFDGKGLTVFLEFAPGRNVRGFTLTAPAYRAVLHGIGLAAHGAAEYARHVLVPHKPAFDRNGLNLANAVASGFNL